ncbi:MAG: DUF11 domain-containing protein, partial [Chloroflexota bacterium]|nr:DUF11 domain-containing protein [Chloroflexota bacterium]
MNPRTAHRSTHRLASLGTILALLLLIAAPVAPAAGVTGPDVVITKSADASSINSSSTLHYTLTARNSGDANATGVVVTDNSIDFNDLQITGLSTSQGSCSAVGAQNDITCAIGTLLPAGQAIVTITAQSKQSTCDGTVRNSARVAAGNEPAANQTNNSSPPVVVTITDCSGPPTDGVDVTITKHASASTIAANGAALTYTLTANNDGTQATANGAVLRVTDNSIDFNDL